MRIVIGRYTGTKGLYLSAVMPESVNSMLRSAAQLFGVTCNPDLHCTVMYSTEPIDIGPVDQCLKYTGLITGFSVIQDHKNRDLLIANVVSEALTERHALFRRLGCKTTFPTFLPHITLGRIGPGFDSSAVERYNSETLARDPILVKFKERQIEDLS